MPKDSPSDTRDREQQKSGKRLRKLPKSPKTSEVCSGREALFLLLEMGTDRIQDPLFIGKLPRFQLGIDQVAIHGEFETATSARDQLEVLNLLLVGGQELVRQTDGLRLVVSHRAILEFQVHIFSFPD